MNDLFGNPVVEKRESDLKGYAARPGSGPSGETCKTCAHVCAVKHSKTYYKCGLIRHCWTGGPGTDIRLKSPACKFWEGDLEQ